MIFRSKIKWAALGGLILSIVSLVVHLFLAKYSTVDLVHSATFSVFPDDLSVGVGPVRSLFFFVFVYINFLLVNYDCSCFKI